MRVVVTGSSRGLGAALAEEFLERGQEVAISSRSAESVNRRVSELQQVYGSDRIFGTVCDVVDASQVHSLWDQTVDRFGGVDIWINNAGFGSNNRNLVDSGVDQYRSTIETNIIGTLNGCRVALEEMAPRGGLICLMEGMGSDGTTMPKMAAYGASKRAIRYLCRALAKECNGTSTSIIGLSPGMVTTDLLVGDLADRDRVERERIIRIFSILADDAKTVSTYLVDRLLDSPRNGSRIAWLTRRKIMLRFFIASVTSKRRRTRLFGSAHE